MNVHSPFYGRVTRAAGRWHLSDVPPHVAIRMKSMFARIPKTQTKHFSLPMTDEMSADLAWFMERYPMDMSDEDRGALFQQKKLFEDDRASLHAITLPEWKPDEMLHGFRPGNAPNAMQRVAIELAHRRRSLLLADDVGLGKTWSALGTIAGSNYLPAAAVAQTHLPTQWKKEFIEPYTYMGAHIIEGTTPYSLPPANIYLFRYSNIAGWSDVLATGFFKAAIFDEIQELRTGTGTAKGGGAMALANNVALRLGLSATPIYGYGSEIWNIMQFIDADVLGPWDEFTREWCVSSGGKWLLTDPEALGTYLRDSHVFLRRLREGRKINKHIIEVDYDEDVERETLDLARTLALRVVNGTFSESGAAARELDMLARHTTGVAKARGVAAVVRVLAEKGTRVILTGWHRDVYDIWLRDLAEFKPIMFTGSETPKQKDKAKADFIAGLGNPLILSNRSGVGLDGLQKVCSTIVIGELDWSSQIYEQIYGRVDRQGQPEDEITAIFCTSSGGSDPVLMQVNAIKANQSRGLLDPGLGVVKQESDVSHIRMLAEAYLRRTSR